jgi:hypothetical protein
MRNPWKDESMKKVKRYEDGGDVSLEKKYPGAKITKGEYQGKHPDLPPTKNPETQASREQRAIDLKKDLEKTSKPEYEQKAEKFERTKPKGGGGGGGVLPLDKMLKMNKMNYKAGGKVSSASKRADGCAIRGKTRA